MIQRLDSFFLPKWSSKFCNQHLIMLTICLEQGNVVFRDKYPSSLCSRGGREGIIFLAMQSLKTFRTLLARNVLNLVLFCWVYIRTSDFFPTLMNQ